MWQMFASEEQSGHLNHIFKAWGDDQPMASVSQMDSESNDQQAKQERLRTRWTPALDKIFADIVVEHILQGNRSNDVFDKKTWNQIRDGFNRQTNLNFNNNQLRKHLDVLRTRYHNLQSAFNQNDTIHDPCFMGFDLWEDIGAQSRIEPTKAKECPIYDQLCTIFADTSVDGKYAQSSHYGEFCSASAAGIASVCPSSTDGVNPHPETPSTSKPPEGNGSSPQTIIKNTMDKKRKRPVEATSTPEQSSWNQELGDAMTEAMLDLINSSKLKILTNSMCDERFTISNCIKILDEIKGIEDAVYYAALDMFENPNFREVFVSLNSNHTRLLWLQGNCRTYASYRN